MKKLYKLKGIPFLVAGLLGVVSIQFGNPDMTQTQLLIEYYPEYAVLSVCLILGYTLIVKGE